MSVTIASDNCSILKSIMPIVKAEKTSIQVGKDHINMSMANPDLNILFHHQIAVSNVEKSEKYAVATERLVALLCGKPDTQINLNYDGSALKYKYRKNKGSCETHTFEAHETPKLTSDRNLTSLVRKHFNMLSLKPIVDGTELYLFIDEEPDHTNICVSDSGGYHAAVIKLKTKNETANHIAIPLLYVQGAIRTLKEDIRMCSDAEHLYCFKKNKEELSIIRFRNILDTRDITSKLLIDAANSKDKLSFKATANLFDDIIADFKIGKDKERGGVIKAVLSNGGIKLSYETRHGSSVSEPKLKTKIEGDHTFMIPFDLLQDTLRLKGSVVFSLKEDMNIFTMHQYDEELKMSTTFLCTVEK